MSATTTGNNVHACVRSCSVFQFLSCRQWFNGIDAAASPAEVIEISADTFTKWIDPFRNSPAFGEDAFHINLHEINEKETILLVPK